MKNEKQEELSKTLELEPETKPYSVCPHSPH